MSVVTLTNENFDREVMEAQVPVLIDFWATWCGPCRMQAPIVDEVAEEMGDKVKVCKVDVDEQSALALKYGIMNIPTLVYMKKGEFQNKMVGLQEKQTIVDYLNSLA